MVRWVAEGSRLVGSMESRSWVCRRAELRSTTFGLVTCMLAPAAIVTLSSNSQAQEAWDPGYYYDVATWNCRNERNEKDLEYCFRAQVAKEARRRNVPFHTEPDVRFCSIWFGKGERVLRCGEFGAGDIEISRISREKVQECQWDYTKNPPALRRCREYACALGSKCGQQTTGVLIKE